MLYSGPDTRNEDTDGQAVAKLLKASHLLKSVNAFDFQAIRTHVEGGVIDQKFLVDLCSKVDGLLLPNLQVRWCLLLKTIDFQLTLATEHVYEALGVLHSFWEDIWKTGLPPNASQLLSDCSKVILFFKTFIVFFQGARPLVEASL